MVQIPARGAGGDGPLSMHELLTVRPHTRRRALSQQHRFIREDGEVKPILLSRLVSAGDYHIRQLRGHKEVLEINLSRVRKDICLVLHIRATDDECVERDGTGNVETDGGQVLRGTSRRGERGVGTTQR
jgi:hypothetical protein